MRRQSPQLSLNCQAVDHDHAKELAVIDGILKRHPRIKEHVKQDLLIGVSNPATGAPGMTGDQVFRALLIKPRFPVAPGSTKDSVTSGRALKDLSRS